MPYIIVKLAMAQPLTALKLQQLIRGVTEVMEHTLRKKRHLVAVTVEYLPPDQWFVAEQAISTQTAFIQAYIMAGTNTETEKTQAILELYRLLTTLLGLVEKASYIVLTEISASDWGYAGQTQAQRYLASQYLTNDKYQFYIQRAHALQRAEIDALFLKLANLVKRVVRFCTVDFFTKMFADRSSSAKRVKSV
ncbi:4-oxalocrotonate tautomerase family protein [uncultured Thiothrix sp.]|jgi:4-oxalocrotonate tautomerase|uniref:tautomerase family protein n=1 Tax=uncultured Thiothrix sp. TaxID=223185 RepID=UPI002607FDF4|nr:4-oxalocrotonate tautomerase family protein [uncultured Thiothrix sp.]HMT94448.1 4-oxalocrotonate tautomerase family protein [Thiolinea sp.]